MYVLNYIKVLNLLIGFPKNKYTLNDKKLPEVFINRGGFSIRGKGLYMLYTILMNAN